MSTVETRYEHIVLNDRQVPIIEGTTMKVVELVAQKEAFGWNADELHDQYPHLTLGQVHSALAYYYDHRDEIDEDLRRRHSIALRIHREIGDSEVVARLRNRGCE